MGTEATCFWHPRINSPNAAYEHLLSARIKLITPVTTATTLCLRRHTVYSKMPVWQEILLELF